MSRRVDLDKPLSEEDRRYLLERGKYIEVRKNDRRFRNRGITPSSGSPAPDPTAEPATDGRSAASVQEATAEPAAAETTTSGSNEPSPEDREWVYGLTVEELREELEDRDLSKSGNKEELRARLLAAVADED